MYFNVLICALEDWHIKVHITHYTQSLLLSSMFTRIFLSTIIISLIAGTVSISHVVSIIKTKYRLYPILF